ncbi:MAG: hypothetical protein WC570_04090 [Patescibacteria group bacterium]
MILKNNIKDHKQETPAALLKFDYRLYWKNIKRENHKYQNRIERRVSRSPENQFDQNMKSLFKQAIKPIKRMFLTSLMGFLLFSNNNNVSCTQENKTSQIIDSFKNRVRPKISCTYQSSDLANRTDHTTKRNRVKISNNEIINRQESIQQKLLEAFINPQNIDDVKNYVLSVIDDDENIDEYYEIINVQATGYCVGSICKNGTKPTDGLTAAVPPQYQYFGETEDGVGTVAYFQYDDQNLGQGPNPGYFFGCDIGPAIDGEETYFDLYFDPQNNGHDICTQLGDRNYDVAVLKPKFVKLLIEKGLLNKIKQAKIYQVKNIKNFILSDKFNPHINR